MAKEKVTNAELRKSIRQKAKKAHPLVRTEINKMAKYANKRELNRINNNMRVTRGGDVDMSKRGK